MPVPGSAAELRRVPIFAKLAAARLAELEAVAFVRRLARGQLLFVTGEPADHLFVVRAGSLKVHVTSEHGGDYVLAILGPGQALGELSVIDRGPRSADVTALAAAELLAVPAAAVQETLLRDSRALWTVAEGLAVGMRRLTQQAADLVFLDLPRRLAKLLVDSSVTEPDGNRFVPLPVNQSELAAMLGVTRQSLNRALSGMVRRGWIESREQSVRLVDVAALTRFVDS